MSGSPWPGAPVDPWAVPTAPPRAAPYPAPPPPDEGVAALAWPPPTPPPGDGPWLRLHPLTPLLRGGRLLALVAVAVYQQVLREAGALVGAGLLAAALPVAVVAGWVSWRRTRYRVAEGDLQVETGVLVRRSRRVPLARLQAVDVVRGPVARLVGLAELRLEVVGGESSEAPLAYLTAPEAAALRAHLLALAGVAAPGAPLQAGTGPGPGPAAGADGAAAPQPARPALLRVPTARLLGSALLTGPALVAAVLLVASAVTLAVEPGARGVVTASLVPGLLGSGGVLLRRLAGEWGFSLTEDPDGLRLRHGLLETRAQSIPRDRVQGVRVVEPVLWRPLGWVRVEVDVAGYGSGAQEEQARTRALVPVAPRAEAQRVLDATLPGAAPGLLTARGLLPAPGLLTVPGLLPAPSPPAGAPGLPVDDVGVTRRDARPPRRALLVAPLAWRRLRVRVGEHVTATTGGVLQSVTDVVPHAKVQSLRVVQGPVQRRLRLASLHLDTAGRYVAGRAAHRDEQDADDLLAELVERTRAAREGRGPRERDGPLALTPRPHPPR